MLNYFLAPIAQMKVVDGGSLREIFLMSSAIHLQTFLRGFKFKLQMD